MAKRKAEVSNEGAKTNTAPQTAGMTPSGGEPDGQSQPAGETQPTAEKPAAAAPPPAPPKKAVKKPAVRQAAPKAKKAAAKKAKSSKSAKPAAKKGGGKKAPAKKAPAKKASRPPPRSAVAAERVPRQRDTSAVDVGAAPVCGGERPLGIPTVSANCTRAQIALGMGGDPRSVPSASRPALRSFEGPPIERNGLDFYLQACEQDLEGIVAKLKHSVCGEFLQWDLGDSRMPRPDVCKLCLQTRELRYSILKMPPEAGPA